MSDRYTLGFEPSLLLRMEKNPCSPDAKCVLWESHMFQSSRLAHAPLKRNTPAMSVACIIRERIDLLLCCFSSPPVCASLRSDRRPPSPAAPGHARSQDPTPTRSPARPRP